MRPSTAVLGASDEGAVYPPRRGAQGPEAYRCDGSAVSLLNLVACMRWFQDFVDTQPMPGHVVRPVVLAILDLFPLVIHESRYDDMVDGVTHLALRPYSALGVTVGKYACLCALADGALYEEPL